MRNRWIFRSLALLAWVSLISALTPPVPARAQEAKPAKKDSRPQNRPKQAVLTTSVSPSEARPGDVVTYSVTAKLEAPWHIYNYSKDDPNNGPKLTQFDFFDKAGLTPQGDWAASREPIRKKEAAFPNLPFLEYYEDEITWSLKLKIPARATPGKKTLRCQAGYMICSDENCSFPGQWTLPDVELTILPGTSSRSEAPGNGLALAVASAIQAAPAVEAPRPKTKDSRIQPKQASFTTEISPSRAKPGETVTLKVTAKVAAPWHIYKFSSEQPADGPKLTSFELFDPAGLVPKGEWTPSRPPIKKQDTAFKDIPFLEFYEDEVSWSLPMEVAPGITSGKKSVKVQVGFMLCTDANCTPPVRQTLPDAEVEVVDGAAPAPASTPATAAKVEEPRPAAPAPSARVEKPRPTAAAPVAGDKTEATAAPEPTPAPRSTGNPEDGFLSFLLFCAGGGLFALAMPCVWPMIPITVNFFVKQGQKKQGSTTGLAITYCLSIIGIFMAIGLLFSISFGAASLSKLANNPWVNLFVAGLFLVFGLSLLGLFELRLPNFLLNASAQGESKGGLIGVMFMALTLTITSFTCTFPVVGLLLVMAAKGQLLYPIIGLATFATVLALPFFLLALSPGLLAKMPRSGDWMNTVKVVGGLVEIGAAFKFINTAETVFVVPSDAWFNAYTVLTLWIVLALICGIYLLGLFRTDHDYEEIKIGPGRLLTGWLFLSLALFLTPALFGRPPQSKVWYLVVGLLPADAGDLKSPAGGGGGEMLARAATSKDPKQAEREQTAFHGVAWGMSFEGALERAKVEKKPVLIDFTGVNCANCRLMEQEVLPRPEVVALLGEFVTIQLYTDVVPINSISPDDRLKLADENIQREAKLFDEVTNPNYVALDGDGNVLGKLGGKVSPEVFAGFLKGALDRHKVEAGKVAQAGSGG